jgi:glycosyltransferase involved in cell wall biosynthesis
MVQRKGIRSLLEAMLSPRLAARNVHLAITTSHNTSEREFLAEIRALTATAELRDRVTFLVDAFTPEEMPDVYRSAECVMLLSSAEGFGLVGIEALASGIPLVASLSTGINEYLRDEVTGLAVSAGASGEIAEAVVRLVDRPLLRSFLAKNGRNVAIRDFSHAVMMREVERAYMSVIPAARRSPPIRRNVISVNGVRALFASRQRR